MKLFTLILLLVAVVVGCTDVGQIALNEASTIEQKLYPVKSSHYSFSCFRRWKLCQDATGCASRNCKKGSMGKNLTVETQENMTAVLGGNVTFSCTTHLKEILQVTWQKLNSQSEENIATFSENFGPNVIGSFSGRAAFIPTKMEVSTIALSGVKLEDEGCYQCVFHTFSAGSNVGKTCLTVHGKDLTVETQQNMTAVLGGNVIFNCTTHLKDILQVTWRKLNSQSEENIATFSENFGPNLFGSFSGRAAFIPSKMEVSTIALSGVRLEDEGCYQCVFHTFRTGSNIGKTCLNVHAHTSPFRLQQYAWIIIVLVAILIVIFIFSFNWYKKRRYQLRAYSFGN